MYDPHDNHNASYEPTRDASGEYTPYELPEPRSSKNNRGMTGGKIVALALSCSLLGGLVGAGAASLVDKKAEASNIYEGQRLPTVLNTIYTDTSKELSLAELYAMNVNSTVGIATTAVTTNYWGYRTTKAASGSGFIFSDDG